MVFLIKLIGFCLITAATTIVGFNLSYGLKHRAETLEWYLHSIQLMCDRIRYSSAELAKIVEELPAHNKYFTVYKPFKVAVLQNGLNADDICFINEFFSRLGMGDTAEQMNLCALYLKELGFRLGDAQKEYKEKSKPIKTLGFFAGLGIAIILI